MVTTNLNKEFAFVVLSHSKNMSVLVGMLRSFNKKKFTINNSYIIFNDNIINDIELNGFKPIVIEKSNWKQEMLDSLKILKSLNYKKIVFYLDDFYLTDSVNTNLLNHVIEYSFKNDVKYLRLSPSEGSFIKRINDIYCTVLNKNITQVSKKHKYYFSLQTALWDIDYLINTVLKAKDIWNFETLYPGNFHHLETSKKVFTYRHSVEKNKWKYYTPIIFKKYTNGLLNDKLIEKPFFKYFLADVFKRIKFFLFGYL